MSGSATVGTVTTTSADAAATQSGPFQAYTLVSAQALNAALAYGNKLGGYLDNVIIGQSSPNMATFTVLKAQTPAAGDNSTNVATTAWVNQNGTGGGGGGSISLNSPAFTGVPTAPTAPSGTNTQQLATTAFVGNALGNDVAGSTYAGAGTAGMLRDNGSGTPTTVTTFPWPPFNVSTPTANMVVKMVVNQPCTMTGVYVQAPGATGGNSFPITITQNGSQIGSTYTGTASSTSVNTLGSTFTFQVGDVVSFTVGAMTGTPPMAFIQPVGNYA